MEENNEVKKFPYDDDDMVYDYKNHRYILTEKCVFDELGINLSAQLNMAGDSNNTAVINRILSRASRTLYNWIYANGGNTQWQEYMLATFPPLRENIKEMLIIMLDYNLRESNISTWSGINQSKGTYIDRSVIKRAQVPIEIENIANQLLPCIGVSILYAGYNTCVPYHALHNGY